MVKIFAVTCVLASCTFFVSICSYCAIMYVEQSSQKNNNDSVFYFGSDDLKN